MSRRGGRVRSFDVEMSGSPGDNPRAGRADARLSLVPIGVDSWRLCDSHAPRDDASHVVAYLEREGAAFEVVWLRGSDLPRHVGSILEALDLAEQLVRECESHGPKRPVPIAHFAPTSTGAHSLDSVRQAGEASTPSDRPLTPA